MFNSESINELFLSYRAALARAVSRIVPPHEIEDIVQETYVRVCQFKSTKPIEAPKALMVKVAQNLAFDHIKRAEWRLRADMDVETALESGKQAAAGDATLNQAVSDEEFGQFCEAVRKLPLQCRRVFVLKKVYGCSQAEIASQLGISENTVEKHIAKGMSLCAEELLGTNTSNARANRRHRKVATPTGGDL
jgi:RNA polymerase sigma factor (sigma-70 family)